MTRRPVASYSDRGALRLVLAALATWRLTHLLVEEDGPGHVLGRLRGAVDRTPLVGLLDCFGCASVWVGVGVAALDRFSGGNRGYPARTSAVSAAAEVAVVMEVAVTGLALSGAAFTLQKVLARDEPPTWLDEPDVDSPLVNVEPT